jgi:L-aminopeptidase/D-esterase-like protein
MHSGDDLGVLVGHCSDARGATGCTVIVCPQGAVGGVSVRGGAPCTRETDIFRPGAGVDPRLVHGVLLTGGSVFGLAAADGVVRYLAERDVGLRTGHACVPIVATAGLYDLSIGDPGARPDAECGYAACAAAGSAPAAEGSVGAGTGATVGKAAGMGRCCKGGLGIATERLAGGIAVRAVVAVNAFGEVIDPSSGQIAAGVRREEGEGFVPTGEILGLGSAAPRPLGSTTLAVVITNAALNKEEASELAGTAHDGLAQAIRPAHTRADGDSVFVLSTGGERRGGGLSILDVITLQGAATRAVAAATLRGVRLAASLGGVPAVGPLQAGAQRGIGGVRSPGGD